MAAAILGAVTLIWPDWIERVFSIDPDAGSGWLERLIVLSFALIALVSALGARRDWHRLSSTAAKRRWEVGCKHGDAAVTTA